MQRCLRSGFVHLYDILFILRPSAFRSWWGILWGCVLLGVFAIRIQIEEGTLRKELPGYNEYAARVRYRLIPRVW
jgi:protein-S-isoprenylcysteine O-methyltransferase Ste14